MIWGKAFLLFCFWLASFFLYAAAPVKFGKLSREEINLKSCQYEPDAEAVYLLNSGEIKITRSRVFVTKHIRIKILSEAGFKNANITIPLYSKNGYEKIQHIQAQTINTNSVNEPVYFEVNNKNIFTAQISGDWKELRFVFPNVKVGSILEYEYKIISDNFLYLNKWDFQKDLPALHSSLKVLIPEKLDYRVLLQGHRLLQKYRDITTNNWELKDLPSIKAEPFLHNIHDFTETIQFQLAGYYSRKNINLPAEYVSLLTTWEDLAENVMSSNEYRSYLNKSGYAKTILNEIGIINLTQMEKMKKIYQYVQKNYSWNGKYRRSTYNRFNEVADNQSGYSSEINLLLTLLLNESGQEAYPMLISTRSHGEYIKEYPFLSQFNHLICLVLIDENKYYLDATDPHRSYQLLPLESYVREGFVLNIKKPHWHALDYHPVSTEAYEVKIDFFNPDSVSFSCGMLYDGYKALQHAKVITDYGLHQFLNNEINYHTLTTNRTVDISEDRSGFPDTLKVKATFMGKLNVQKGRDEKYYLNPIFVNAITENPFHNEIRNYPIQFDSQEKLIFNFKYTFHNGYHITLWPESERIKLPNDYGEFSYTTLKIDDTLRIIITMKNGKIEIPASQYNNIREYYALILSKLSQPIVLVKD